ncbi:NUDIX hydrolase [Aeromicrobium sp. CF3.5]|uniref:NUDIX hydrolase n=1 Tax=Aeromicrobium sp. CF3.5 TaxID=3373078 RepID=UPI003EE48334
MSSSLRDEDLVLEPTSGSDQLIGFAVEHAGERVGTLAFRRESARTVSIRWNMGEHALALAVRVLRLAIPHAFDELDATRVEARIPVDRTDDVRAASISGLRREGILRGAGSDPDRALMARLVDDPPTGGRDGFIAILNAGLPTKRAIGQGLLRDQQGRVLLCELTYKREWDLPGGVVEVGESPALGLVRELREELDIEAEIRGLVTVNWLPAWRGWDDACIFLFDLGTVDAAITESMSLQPTEIKAVHWCDPATIREKATAATVALLEGLSDGDNRPYREAPEGP